MIQRFELTDGKLRRGDNDDAPILLFNNPDLVEREWLRDHHKLDEHALASALDPDEVSRIEFHPDSARKTTPVAATWCSKCHPAACCFRLAACW